MQNLNPKENKTVLSHIIFKLQKNSRQKNPFFFLLRTECFVITCSISCISSAVSVIYFWNTAIRCKKKVIKLLIDKPINNIEFFFGFFFFKTKKS
jgi:hypothetical protein